jgi:hypothetical protein
MNKKYWETSAIGLEVAPVSVDSGYLKSALYPHHLMWTWVKHLVCAYDPKQVEGFHKNVVTI